MPLTVPVIDARRYQDLRDEGLARARTHTPEWNAVGESDPGVTLVEVFAFIAESVLYRANQIPERNRRKFLALLGVPLAPAAGACGIVAFANERGPLETVTLPAGLVLQAGRVPFRVDQGLDVLPVEGRVFVKREAADQSPAVRAYYDQLYASFLRPALASTATLYETVPLGRDGVDLAGGTVDRAFWVALLARQDEDPEEARARIAGKTLTLGVVPWLVDATRRLTPTGAADQAAGAQLACHIPLVSEDGRLPTTLAERVPRYRPLAVVGGDVLVRPGAVQVTLPDRAGLRLWTNLDPLEAGVGDFPPAIDNTGLEARLVTWLRFSAPARAEARVLWVGINAAMVSQRQRVAAERLPDGTGAPEQVARLARRPVLPDSVRLHVTRAEGGDSETWLPVQDLLTAGAEVPVLDPRVAPGAPQPKPRESRVFTVDAEAGELRFGDGLRGARPPLGATLVADYEYSEGREGNVSGGAIRGGPTLPPGFTAANPVRTWGGADAETVAEGEKQVQRWVQHRDRLVTAEDFATLAWRTPGVEVGRVDVIPAASPELGTSEPGDAPGAVTLMLVPRRDPEQPDAPSPDGPFLDAVCAWLDPRRLVTTELFLWGPRYKRVWVSVGIDVAMERGIAEVRQAVERALREALAPLPPEGADVGTDPLLPVFAQRRGAARGWPLRKPVVALELAAVAARVPGVTAVRELLLAGDADTGAQPSVDMRGLELPRVAGIMVSVGPAMSLDDLRGTTGVGAPGTGGPMAPPRRFVPVPVVPGEC